MKHSNDFKQLCANARQHVTEIDSTTLKSWLAEQKPVHLIDVRDQDEFDAGHIETATHLSKGWIEAKIHHLVDDKDALVVLYCGGGNRSILAAENLQKMGYTKVLSLAGGFKQWIKQNLF